MCLKYLKFEKKITVQGNVCVHSEKEELNYFTVNWMRNETFTRPEGE